MRVGKPELGAWSEQRPKRDEGDRHEIARRYASLAGLPDNPPGRFLSEADIDAMKAAFIARFDEDLPRTETLFYVANVGYRMALRDTAQGIVTRSDETLQAAQPEGLEPGPKDAPNV